MSTQSQTRVAAAANDSLAKLTAKFAADGMWFERVFEDVLEPGTNVAIFVSNKGPVIQQYAGPVLQSDVMIALLEQAHVDLHAKGYPYALEKLAELQEKHGYQTAAASIAEEAALRVEKWVLPVRKTPPSEQFAEVVAQCAAEKFWVEKVLPNVVPGTNVAVLCNGLGTSAVFQYGGGPRVLYDTLTPLVNAVRAEVASKGIAYVRGKLDALATA